MPWADAFGMVRSGVFSGPSLPRDPSGIHRDVSRQKYEEWIKGNRAKYGKKSNQRFLPLPLEYKSHFNQHFPPRG